VKAPGFVRRLHRSRGESKAGLGARGRSMPLRAIDPHAVRQGCPPPIPSRPLGPRARSLVESGRPVERELDSQPGNRCSAARGLRWPTPASNSRPARGVTGRSRVCSTFTSVAEVGERYLVCSRSSWSRPRRNGGPSSSEETRLGRTAPTHRWKALRIVERRFRSCGPAGNDPRRSVRGKPVRVRSRSNMPPPSRTRVIRSE
jgi:hypothetical protein